MAIAIPLSAIPNQAMSFLAEDVNVRYELTIKELPGKTMGVTIAVDGVVLVNNSRAVANVPLLKFEYLQEIAQGNFMFVSDDQLYPYYDQFETTATLVYASALEIAALQAAADAINPLTALGATRITPIRNTVAINSEPFGGYDPANPTNINFVLKYKGGDVVSANSVTSIVKATGGGVVGTAFTAYAIDGTHVTLQAPLISGESLYWNGSAVINWNP